MTRASSNAIGGEKHDPLRKGNSGIASLSSTIVRLTPLVSLYLRGIKCVAATLIQNVIHRAFATKSDFRPTAAASSPTIFGGAEAQGRALLGRPNPVLIDLNQPTQHCLQQLISALDLAADLQLCTAFPTVVTGKRLLKTLFENHPLERLILTSAYSPTAWALRVWHTPPLIEP